MKLRQRMLVVFAATVAAGMVILYFISNGLLLQSFLRLEDEQVKQEVAYAVAALKEEYRAVGNTTNDYAYWDRTYEFMANPNKGDIGQEFQNGEMEGLGLNLVVIRDLQGNTIFAKAYDRADHKETAVPVKFLEHIFSRPQMKLEAANAAPHDGLLAFPDALYILSVRPILTSQRGGPARGVLLIARKFDEQGASRIAELTRTAVKFQRQDDPGLPPESQEAFRTLSETGDEAAVAALSEQTITGYHLLPDIFGKPLLILRVDSRRPIYERGKLSQRYLFGTVFIGSVLSSLVIIFFLQHFVLSRLGALSREINSIGKRKAVRERVRVSGGDELSGLGGSINEMLDELERRQKQFLMLTENIHQVFWIRDVKSGKFEFISRVFEKIWGRSCESLTEDPALWTVGIHPEDRPEISRMLADQLKGEAAEAHYRITAADGTIKWLWERSFPLFDDKGNLARVTGLIEDITEFRRNEEALRNSQSELEDRVAHRTAELAERSELARLLINFAPGAIYGMDADGICTFCNPAAVRTLGYGDAFEIVGRPIHQLIHHTRADGSVYPEPECPVFRSFETEIDAQVSDDLFWRKDGSSFPVEYSSRQIRQKGEVVGAVVSFADLTDRKRQELEERHGQKLEAVGRLAAGIAHEINTPIQFVGDNTRFLLNSFQDELKLIRKYEQLREQATKAALEPALLAEIGATRSEIDWPYLEEEIPRAIDQMLEGLGRVSTIVRGMKEFSHVDRSNEKAPGDINRALESTLIVARNELKYVADVETDFGQLPPVICHLGDLNQVFLNLLINAAHAIDDVVKETNGKGKIKVSTHCEGDWVEIRIQDSGSGIPEEARDKVFDPFFTTKAVGKGTGQGLALARAIVVEKHGGTITFDTEIGKGTTFFIRLPLKTAAVREGELVK